MYSEYLNNPYFQIYVNSLSPILVPIVSVGFGIASATVATVLYFTMRNITQRGGLKEDELSRTRGPAKKTGKKPQISSSRSEKPVTGGLAAAPKSKPIAGTSSLRRGTAPASRADEDESD
ncbi:MAG TPA: hypothetical protein VF906_07075 [Candidatus Bathyarchaeia archaeon]